MFFIMLTIYFLSPLFFYCDHSILSYYIWYLKYNLNHFTFQWVCLSKYIRTVKGKQISEANHNIFAVWSLLLFHILHHYWLCYISPTEYHCKVSPDCSGWLISCPAENHKVNVYWYLHLSQLFHSILNSEGAYVWSRLSFLTAHKIILENDLVNIHYMFFANDLCYLSSPLWFLFIL